MMTDEDRKIPVWLRLTVGSDSPACSIYLGDEKPETSVFGTGIQMYLPLSRFDWSSACLEMVSC